MRTQRLAIVTSSGGTCSARMTNTVPGGGSSIVLSSAGAASSTRWKSVSTSTLRAPSTGTGRRPAGDLAARRRRAATRRCRSTTTTSGWTPASDPPADLALVAAAVRAQQLRGEGRGPPPLAGSRRPDEQVGVHRRAGRGAQLGDGPVLADDVGVETGHRRPPTRGTRRSTRAATSSMVPLPSTTPPVAGRPRPARGSPRRRGVELGALRLEPVGHRVEPRECRRRQQDDEVGLQAARGPRRQLAQLVDVEAAPVALVRERRRRVPVADHVGAALEGGRMTAATCSARAAAISSASARASRPATSGIEQQLADLLADAGAARLAGQHRADRIGEPRRLRRLAASLAALEGDEAAAAHDRSGALGAQRQDRQHAGDEDDGRAEPQRQSRTRQRDVDAETDLAVEPPVRQRPAAWQAAAPA